jgi:predicted dehydrogenase
VPIGYASVDDLPASIVGRHAVISICSPTALHREHLAAALELKPRAIFCEKPVTPTLAETCAAVSRCEAAGVLLAVNHTRRWAPDVAELATQLRDGRWGPLRSVVGHYNKGMLNNGSHMIDLLHALVGPLEFLAAGTPCWDHWPNDPTIPAMLRTASGVPVHLATAHAGDCAMFELQLVTATAVITMEEGGLHWRVRRTVDSPRFRGYRSLDAGMRHAGDYAEAMLGAINNLHAALAKGAKLASTGASAIEAQRLCEQIRSAATAHLTTVPAAAIPPYVTEPALQADEATQGVVALRTASANPIEQRPNPADLPA